QAQVLLAHRADGGEVHAGDQLLVQLRLVAQEALVAGRQGRGPVAGRQGRGAEVGPVAVHSAHGRVTLFCVWSRGPGAGSSLDVKGALRTWVPLLCTRFMVVSPLSVSGPNRLRCQNTPGISR